MWIVRLGEMDARALAWVAGWRSDWLVGGMRGVTRTGDASVVTALLAIALALWPGRAAVLATVSTMLGLALFSAIKRVCGRTRPAVFALLEAPDRFSMPSGHATCAWSIAVSLAVMLPAAAPFVLLWAFAISLSRVVLGVHYPLDVLAGALLGTASAATTMAVLSTLL